MFYIPFKLLFTIGSQDGIVGCAFSIRMDVARDGNILGKPWTIASLES